MKILGLDLETGNPFKDKNKNDTHPKDSWITEIGAVLYDTDFGDVPVEIFSALINEKKGVDPQAEAYTGISSEMVKKYGRDPKAVGLEFLELLKDVDYVVAHNGNKFDEPVLREFIKRHFGNKELIAFSRPWWIDTMFDIEYPINVNSKSLGALAASHIILNSFPHRAITDVMTMMSVFFRYDLDRILKVSKSPTVVVKAIGPIDKNPQKKKQAFIPGTKENLELEQWKSEAKHLGFRWDGDSSVTGDKCWYRCVKKIHLKENKNMFNDLETEVLMILD